MALRGRPVTDSLSPQWVESGHSACDAVIATEQAIRLEELQNWVRRQAAVNPPAVESPGHR